VVNAGALVSGTGPKLTASFAPLALAEEMVCGSLTLLLEPAIDPSIEETLEFAASMKAGFAASRVSGKLKLGRDVSLDSPLGPVLLATPDCTTTSVFELANNGGTRGESTVEFETVSNVADCSGSIRSAATNVVFELDSNDDGDQLIGAFSSKGAISACFVEVDAIAFGPRSGLAIVVGADEAPVAARLSVGPDFGP